MNVMDKEDWSVLRIEGVFHKSEMIYCYACGRIHGFVFKDKENKEIHGIKVTIGDTEYPLLDLSKLEEDFDPIICSCGERLLRRKSNEKELCGHLEDCVKYSAMTLDPRAVGCEGCSAYEVTK